MNRLLLLLVMALLSAGNVWADNSRFYGLYSYTQVISMDAECGGGHQTSGTVEIGSNSSLAGTTLSDGTAYLYIPATETSETYSQPVPNSDVQMQVTVTINGDSIEFSSTFSGITEINTWTFTNNYNDLTISGTSNFGCNYQVTGNGTRIGGASNSAPLTPTLAFPANGSIDVSLTPSLTANTFSDPDTGDTHLQTEWQISTSNDFSTSILYEKSRVNLTSLSVPDLMLQDNTTYYWRVRFYDSSSTVSEWSETFIFTTLPAQNDTNENGIPDTLENNTVDLDNDGTADFWQDKIKSLNTAVGNGQMGVSFKDSITVTSITQINSIDPDDISKVARPKEMPLGLFSVRLTVASAGDTADITIYFSQAAPANAVWYFYDSINGWTDYSSHATFSSDRKSVSLQLKDGDYGDSDGIANGIIVDPSGFGLASWINGFVSDSSTGAKITTATLSFTGLDLDLNTLNDGNFLCLILPGTYDLLVSAPGYVPQTISGLQIAEGSITTKNVALSPRCKITGFEVTGTVSTSSPVTFKVNAQSSSKTINYRYSIHPDYGTDNYDGLHWQSMTSTEYQSDNSCNYAFGTAGKSIVVAWATSSDTDSVDPVGIPIIGCSVDTSDSGCKTNFTGVTISGEQKVNQKITFTVNAVDSCGRTRYYRFSMHPDYGTDKYDGTQWESMTGTEWISENSVDHTFTKPGKYIVVVWVTNDTGSVDPNAIPIIGWSVDIE